ncbi:hypothetical protein HOBO_7 [Bacillus phage Hobo]|nr:hypothetical protein HOBO_268 [Bacillus phage Hobo]AXQ67036.1 hypothetical protein HOBO_7 [Bacillus phage Hobo]
MSSDMGVCNFCEETFSRCGEFVGCECGKSWCSESCAEADGYQEEEEGYTPPGSNWRQDTSCDYCRKEDHDDDTLLEYALELLGMTRYELVDKYNSK